MKLRINEKDTLMKYKTYCNIEKCFNILVNEKGYSKEEAQNIIDHILADYKYNPNSNNSLLRQINLVLSKDEYEKEYGIAERYTRLQEKETPNIEVKHKGILEVPEGKNVDDLPLSHFVNLANKKGLSKITKALNNLQVWNKNDDPKLSKWAGDMIDKLNKKLKKDESLNKSLVKEDFVYPLSVLSDWWYDVIEQAKKFGIKDSEIDSKDENTLLFTVPEWDGLGFDRYVRLRSWCEKHIYNSPEYIEASKELNESLTKENSKKSYWKYYQNDKAIERMENSDNYYFDGHSIKQVKLYPCETEDECYEGDFWPVRKSDYPYTAIFGTKDEAYKELMYSLNNSMYERENDL